MDRQKDLSLDAPEMTVLNMLREGEPACEFIAEGNNIFVPTRLLAEATRLSPKDEKALGDALRVIAVLSANGQSQNTRRVIRNEQRRGFVLPPLDEARRLWEKHKGRLVEWPVDVPDWATATEIPF